MKQAILITAYKDIAPVIDMINFFDSNFNFYVHVDRKANINFSTLKAFSNVTVFSQYRINWGGVNHLKAILLLAKAALKNNYNVFFHLITAEDFPVKSIAQFGNLDLTSNYIEYFRLPNAIWQGNGGMDRIDYYNFFDHFNARAGRGYRIIERILAYQHSREIKRRYPAIFTNLPLYGGSTYWSLNRQALQYVGEFADHHPEVLRRFNYTFCAEEMYFQTILLSSPLMSTLVNDNLRYIDWNSGRGGHPAFLDETDFESIVSSNKLFARKLDSRSESLRKRLIRHLQKMKLNSRWVIRAKYPVEIFSHAGN